MLRQPAFRVWLRNVETEADRRSLLIRITGLPAGRQRRVMVCLFHRQGPQAAATAANRATASFFGPGEREGGSQKGSYSGRISTDNGKKITNTSFPTSPVLKAPTVTTSIIPWRRSLDSLQFSFLWGMLLDRICALSLLSPSSTAVATLGIGQPLEPSTPLSPLERTLRLTKQEEQCFQDAQTQQP